MFEAFREGGWPMFGELLLGIVTIIAAVRFAWRPKARRIDAIKALTTATVFATVAGTAEAFSAVMHNVPRIPAFANDPKIHLIIMQGLGEATQNAILGLTLLTIAWLVSAVGCRKLAVIEAA